jgi:hypothetical protein
LTRRLKLAPSLGQHGTTKPTSDTLNVLALAALETINTMRDLFVD